MPRLVDLMTAASGGGSQPLNQAGTVIQSPQGPMVVLPSGEVVPLPATLRGVSGAMPAPSPQPVTPWQMPSPIIGGRG